MNRANGDNHKRSDPKLVAIGIFLLASLIYIACIALFFYPYFDIFTRDLIGPPEDNMQDFWNTWYSQVTLDTNPKDFFFTNRIKFPEGVPLYYQSFSYSNLFIIYVIRKLLSLPLNIPLLVGLHNGMLILSFYLAAIGAFYLTLRFTQNTISALLGGFIYAFSPFHVAHLLHHMHVATIQYIPFFVSCFLSAADTRKLRYVAGSIAFYFLSAISCWYYLFYIGYFLAFYYVYNAIEERAFIVKRLLWPLIATITGVAILLSPILVPMVVEGLKNEGVYALGGHNIHVADLLGYIVFHPYHPLSIISQRIYSHFTGNPWEMSVYLGLVNTGLFAWAFGNRNRLDIKQMNFLVWGLIIFMMFASGVRLHILGVSTIPVPTGVTSHMPFFSNARTPSRAIVFVYLFLGIGVGLAVKATIDHYSSRKGWLFSSLAVVYLLIFLDFYPVNMESTRLECPPAYNIIKQDKDSNFGILDLPRGYRPGNTYMMYQACHERPIVVASITRKLAITLNDTLETTDLDAQRKQLRESKIKYIVIHKNLNSSEYVESDDDIVFIPDYKRTYPIAYSDEDNVVCRVY